ncbi:hypothetical protein [Streptomyces sp. NPDC001282]|uniref:hypothetical protein n=2 Tax=unclassified Streptomyces TaxID=2593676 RepID=UPI00368F325D
MLRRAIVVLMSAQGQPMKSITSLLRVGQDYVRDVIHAFYERGFGALDPKWSGGRPKTVSEVRERICLIARTSPADWGIATFSARSLTKLAEHLVKPEVLLVLSADANGIVMRPDALRPDTAKAAAGKKRGRGVFRTRLASGEESRRKRMAALACVYEAAPAPRRPHDVIAVPGGRTGGRALRKGSRARAKWLTASVDRDAAAVIAAAFGQADARDPAHRRCRMVLVDGDRHQIEPVEAEAARRKVTIHLIVDLIHVIEYLWKASWCFHAKDNPAAEDWGRAEHALALLHGRCAEATTRIARQADDLGLTTERCGGVEEWVRYLANKEPYLGYAQALEQGWPIATGVVESACRHLIADRFNITGSRWSVEGAEALLLLRAVIINGDFEEYWLHHVEQEHLRTRQARHQDGYALTA